MNLQIENIKTEIINVINNSGLPIGVIYYLFKDINDEIAQEYKNTLLQERMDKQKKVQEQKENNNLEELAK